MDKIDFKEIDGVILTELKIIKDDRGAVLHMLRNDSPLFKKFGEVYFSRVLPKKVKAWKLHKKMTQNFAVPEGIMKIVLYDNRPKSKTRGFLQEVILSQKNYKLLTIPPLVWYGFSAIGNRSALLVNCANMPHNPKESEKLPILNKKIPYKWEGDYEE